MAILQTQHRAVIALTRQQSKILHFLNISLSSVIGACNYCCPLLNVYETTKRQMPVLCSEIYISFVSIVFCDALFLLSNNSFLTWPLALFLVFLSFMFPIPAIRMVIFLQDYLFNIWNYASRNIKEQNTPFHPLSKSPKGETQRCPRWQPPLR